MELNIVDVNNEEIEKIEFIEEFSERKNLSVLPSLLSGLIACLSPESTCLLLLRNYTENWDLRRVVTRKVCSDIQNSFMMCHDQLIEGVELQSGELKYTGQQRGAYCLAEIAKVAPEDEKSKIIKFLLGSKYISVRRKGYKQLTRIYKPEYEETLLNAWNQFHDLEGALLVVKEFPLELVIIHKQTLKKVLIKPQHFARLYIRLGETSSDWHQELRKEDGITYSYVMTKLGLIIADEEAIELIKENIFDNRIGLLIWALGKMQKWNVLKTVGNNIDVIEQQYTEYLRARISVYKKESDQ